MKMKVTLDEIYEGMHNKLRKLFIRYCPNCGSNLYYNKTVNGKHEHICYNCGQVIPEEEGMLGNRLSDIRNCLIKPYKEYSSSLI